MSLFSHSKFQMGMGGTLLVLLVLEVFTGGPSEILEATGEGVRGLWSELTTR